MRVDEVPHDFVEHGGPDGADGVDFVELVGAAVGVRVRGQAGRVEVGPETLGVAEDPLAEREVGGAGVGAAGSDGGGHEVAPAFSHASGFQDVEAGSVGWATGQTVGETVGVLVDDDASFKGTVSVRCSLGPDEHPHAAGLSVRRCREICVVGTTTILGVQNDLVISDTTFAVVARLKIPSGLGEAKFVEEIVVPVRGIEELRDRSIDVRFWVGRSKVQGVIEVRRCARRSEVVEIVRATVIVFLRNTIISPASLVCCAGISLPGVWRSGQIPWVRLNDSATFVGILKRPGAMVVSAAPSTCFKITHKTW